MRDLVAQVLHLPTCSPQAPPAAASRPRLGKHGYASRRSCEERRSHSSG